MGNTFSRWRNYAEITYDVITKGIESRADEYKPGKPRVVDNPSVDSVTLNWERPDSLYENHRYHIRYKTNDAEKWEHHGDQPKEETTMVDNLQSKTKYIFQVRMVNIQTEGPYSEHSDTIETMERAAARYLELTYTLENLGEVPCVKRIPLDEDRNARNDAQKIRKFEVGDLNRGCNSEKTIILLGVEGSGKRTFIDGIINYILGVKWTDPYRFTVTRTDTENGWMTQYCINPLPGSELVFKLNIIDTPSLEHSDDEVGKEEILQQLKCLFQTRSKGVKYVDAICFLIKAHDSDFKQSQNEALEEILTLLGPELEENTLTITTFADCKDAPVLQTLGKIGNKHLPFNNSGLFVPTNGNPPNPLSWLFWRIGTECFKSFFTELSALSPKHCIPVLPKRKVQKHCIPVLPKRQDLEDKIEDLQPQFAMHLDEIVQLKTEKTIVENNKHDIEVNATFTYTVKTTKLVKTDLSRGKHVTNCLSCYVTCHEECNIPRNEDKHECWAMDTDGQCRICFDKCHWTSHANTPYIYKYVEVTITKTYKEKEDKYRKSAGEKMTVTKVLDRMGDHLKDLENRIQEKMNEIRVNINLLRRFSNRKDTMTINDQIDLLIKGEKQKKQPDFEKRIEVLMDLRKS